MSRQGGEVNGVRYGTGASVGAEGDDSTRPEMQDKW